MNRIFRVIWSQATQSWVAVSELTKAHKKQSSTNQTSVLDSNAGAAGIFKLSLLTLSLMLGSSAFAAYSAGNNAQATGGSSTAIGDNAKAISAQGISIGYNAGIDSSSTAGQNNIAIGTHSRTGNNVTNASVNQSIAIGSGNLRTEGAWAEGDQSIAIGANTHARGDSSIVIGGDDVDKVARKQITYTRLDGCQTTGSVEQALKNLANIEMFKPEQWETAKADGAAIAIGIKTQASDLAVAVGSLARAEKVNTVSIGAGAIASLDNSVAIGGGAKADNDSAGTVELNATVGSQTYTFAGGENTLPGDIVSFGSKGFERQLKNIAAGKVSRDSRDAINGSQLFTILNTLVSHNYLKYSGDDDDSAANGANAQKVIRQNLDNNKLTLAGGAAADKLSDNNIGVTYAEGKNKEANGNDIPAFLTYDSNGNPTTDESKIDPTKTKANPAYQHGKLNIKLAKELQGLTSANFTSTTGNVTLNADGITIKPNAAGKAPVSLTQNGLDNGNNPITNVAGNLAGSKTGTTAPTTSSSLATGNDAPNTSNAATVGDVLNAGWNLQGNGAAKDFVKPYDTVNFKNGTGTTAVVDTKADNLLSNISFNVNTTTLTQNATTGNIDAGNNGDYFPTAKTVADAINSTRIKYFSVNSNGGKNEDNKGAFTTPESTNGIAIGKDATIQDRASIAIGLGAKNIREKESNTGKGGPRVDQTATSAISVGENATTHFSNAIAIGTNSEARGQSAIVIGHNAKTISPWNDATDRYVQAYRTILLGFSAEASGTNTIGMGSRVKALANNAMVFGQDAQSGHVDTIVMGRGSKTLGGTSGSAGSIAIGQGSSSGSADNNRPSTAVGTGSYAGASFANITSNAKPDSSDSAALEKLRNAPEGLDMSRGATAIGANAGAAYNLVDLLKENVVDSNTKQTVKAGTPVYRQIIRDENNNVVEVRFYTSVTDASDGSGDLVYSYIDMDKVNQGYAANMGTNLDNNTNVLKKAGFLDNGAAAPTSTNAEQTRNGKVETSLAYAKTSGATNHQVAVGMQSRAVGNEAIAIGPQAIAGDSSVVVGSTSAIRAFDAQYVRATSLDGYTSTRDTTSQPNDIDLAVSGPQGYVVDKYAEQVGRGRFPAWNKDNVSYGISGSTVMGAQAHSTAPIGVAVGISSTVARGALGAVAVGPVATVEPNAIGAMALGMGSRVQVDANNAIALGTGAEVQAPTSGNATGAMALGWKAKTNKAASVALGSESDGTNRTATKETEGSITHNIAPGVSHTITYSGFAGVPGKSGTLSPNYFVTVGSDTIKRQIKDVAAGNVSATSTDAINGSQLYSVAKLMISGWNIAGDNKTTVEAIAPTEKVSFLNGTGTTSVVARDGDTSNATVTFNINKSTIGNDTTNTGKVQAADSGDKFATAENVATAINSAYWKAAAGGNVDGTDKGADNITAGTMVTFNAGKNLTVNHTTANNFTFATVDRPEFTGVNLTNGSSQVNLTPTADGLNVAKANGDAAKITNVANGTNANDAVNVSQLNKVGNNTIKLSAVNAINNADQAATSTNTQALNKDGGLEFKVKSADGELLNVTASGDTVTITPVKGSVQVDNDGKASIQNGAATTEGLIEASDLVEALNKMGWKVTSGTEGSGATATGHAQSNELVKFSETVTLKAGDNLKVKQAGKDFTYSLNPELSNLTNATFTNAAGNTTTIDADGVTIKPNTASGKAPVSLTQNGLDNGNNTITNVTSNLPETRNTAVAGDDTKPVTTAQTAPDNIDAIKNNAATVADVLNAGFNLQNNGVAKDFVKPYDTVNFVNGTGTTAVVDTKDNLVSNVTFNVDKSGISLNPTEAGKVQAADSGDKFATAENVATAINSAYWKAAAGGNFDGNNLAADQVTAGTTVTFNAGKNLTVNHTTANNFTFATSANPEFTTVKVGDTVANGKQPVEFKTEAGKTANVNDNQPSTALNVTTTDGKPTQITGVGSVLNTKSHPTNTTGTAGTANLLDLEGTDTNPVNKNAAATVGDLQNMGWIVSAKEGNAYVDTVKNANQVDFVGTGIAKVTGKTVGGIRTITIDANTTSLINSSPFEYTNKTDNTPLTKANDGKFYPSTQVNPDGTTVDNATPVDDSNVVIHAKGNDPQQVTNVKGNLPQVNDADQTIYNPATNTTTAKAPNNANINKAPLTADQAAEIAKNNANNAATVGDVLNAGFNLQNNREARDFVKPFDTMNFVNGGNTKAVVVTNDAGTSSNISVSVTGLPITYTDANGKPVAKVGDNYYPVKEDGTPDTTATPIQAGDLVTNLANPAAKGNEIGAATQLGNVANGAKTFDAPKNGNDDLKLANDGKWYPSTQVNPNGTTVANATPVTPSNVGKSGLVDFANSNPNNAATVGDLQNMGWVISSDKTTGSLSAAYNDQVRNTNEVKFVGTNLATVSGITNATTGVRTITVDVNAQDVLEAAQTPVVYTDANGNKLVKGDDGNFYPADSVKIGDKYYPAGTTTDATGNPVNNGAAAAPVTGTKPADVIASMNDGNSTTTAPMTLSNVKSNLPNVNDAATTITHPNGTTVAADANNIKKAPLTADQAAEIATNNANNAATIGDVLNAGWNLQNNGEARDFVKPYDTVNFVNGGNTKAVVTTDANGTTSDVAIHVTGLPVTYTDANGNPVAKVGDNYYPVDENGNPITKKADGSDADPIDAKTLKTQLTNPAAKPNAIGDATQLGNVNSGLSNYAEPEVNGKAPTKNSLRDLSNSTAVPDTIAATVGDLRNLGWIVSSDKTTGGNGAFSNAVKNANEVRFVGEGSALVSGNVTTDGVNVVTVKVDDQLTTNNSVTPVVYTKADGTKVYPVKDADGNVTYNTQPDGKGDTVADGDVITSVNGPKGTTAPTTLANVKSNLPQVNDADQTIYNPATNTTTAKQDGNANINKAPLTATQAAEIAKNNASNAATVGDVLNAGWNLQNNGEARDFVKPFDTVNFVNGGNTKAVVTTAANGTTSDVAINVTGLPVTYTDANGNPVAKVGDNYYPVDENGNPITKKADGSDADPIDVTTLKTRLTNPSAKPNAIGDATQLGNVNSGLNNYAEPNVDGKAPAKNSLRNLADSTAVPDTIAATVGDLRNLGWIVSSDKTTGGNGEFSNAVKNANEVRFVGEGSAQVSANVTTNGVNVVTVKVDDQLTTNNSVTPVVYTKADGTQVYPVKDAQGNVTYNTKPDGTGDAVPDTDVITSVNGPKGTKAPTTLANVKSNLPQVNDADQTIYNPATNTTTAKAPNNANINKAPLTATQAADIAKNNANNAATVGDVLNAGWNLQNNGEARDFVKPFDTVNFVNGTGTIAVVTTDANGTASNVTFNVDKGTLTPETNGSVTGPVAKDLLDKLDAAKTALAADPENEELKKALDEAQTAVDNAGGNKVATAQNVADAINNSGWNTNSTTATGGATNTLIKPSKAVNFEAGKNIEVTQKVENGNVSYTYATKSEVEFDKVTVGNSTTTSPVVLNAEKAKAATNNGDNNPTTALNITSVDGKPTQITGVGSSLNTTTVNTTPTGNAGDKPVVTLVDLNGSETAPVNKNAAATVGDLQNMGWVVSSDKTTDGEGAYKDAVKNANEVKFVGEGTALVSGKTIDGVRTITVKVDDQLTTNNSVTPVVYTKADGIQVYPVKDAQGNVTYNTKPDGTGDVVAEGDVITSVNGPKGTKAPTTLANVKSNLPQVDDAATTITHPNGTTVAANADNIKKAPLTATQAADIAKNNANNAATVGDVLNAGWNLQNNGEARDFVKPFDTVNFVNGTGTIAVVTTDANGTASNVTFNVDKGTLTPETNGSVTGPVSTELNEALKNAQEAAKKAQEEAAANPTDQALQDAAKKAQDAVNAAQAAVDNAGNKVATAQNVADAINNSGWNTNSTTATGGATNTLIKPSKAVNFEAGKNIEVTQTVDDNGNVSYTYATKDDVSFNTVNVGNPTESYTDENGDVVTKKDGKFFDKNGNEIDPAKVTTTVAPSVKLAAEKAVPANNNNASTAPTTALNISSADGKPSQITGVGSSLNTTTFATAPNGSAGTNKPNVNLLNLGTATNPLPENVLNSVATVRDLTNMGWIVSAEKGNGYIDTVKNANRVDFEGVGLVKVTGETNATTGVRTIKVEVPTNGTVDGVDAGNVNNNPNALMTAEAVSKAIKASGFNLTTSANGGEKLSGSDEVINPGDTVDMSAGKNLTVKQDAKGKVTYATADNVDFSSVTVGNPTYTTADGKPVTKQGDKFFNENGEEVKPSDVTAQAGQAVKFAAENAKPATNNQAGNAPTTALNVTSADGKPTQITGVGSVLDTQTVNTSTGTQGSTPAVTGSQSLVNLGNDPITGQSSLSGDRLNSAATVRDLANMGWVVSAKDNDYTNTVKNANKVEFRGENGISVTGNTNATSGVREITVAIKTGSVDGNGDGSAKGDNGFVTGEQVADAINKSGWNLAANGTEGVKQINPTNTVTFDAGKNMQVVRDGANITYATKDDVNFNSVQFGDENGPKITNKDGNINVSGADGQAPTKITGIAAGDISPTSTDAVNGAQIYALTGGAVTNTTTITGPDGKQHHNVIVDEKGNPSLVTYNVDGRGEYITNSVITAVNNMNQQGIKFFHTNNGTNRDESMDQLTNGEDSRATGSFSTAIGYKAHAAGNNTVAFGSNATTAGSQAIAIGNNAQANGVQTISIGTGNIVNGNNSGAIGDPSVVNATSSYSVGNNNALATGQSDVFAMGNSITQTTSNSVFLGSQSGYVEAVTNADGSINEAASTTAGTKALTQQVTGGVLNQYAGGQEREVVGVVSVGTVGQDANGNAVQQTRRIQNVAPGLISEKSTDAINGSQLYSVASNFNNRLGDLNNKVNRNNKDLRAGIAGANAAAGLPQVYIPGKSMVAAAAGTFKGQSAVAVGYSRASDNGKVILKLQGNANTRGDVGGSVGVGFQW